MLQVCCNINFQIMAVVWELLAPFAGGPEWFNLRLGENQSSQHPQYCKKKRRKRWRKGKSTTGTKWTWSSFINPRITHTLFLNHFKTTKRAAICSAINPLIFTKRPTQRSIKKKIHGMK